MVNEPSVFEPLKGNCIMFSYLPSVYLSYIHIYLPPLFFFRLIILICLQVTGFYSDYAHNYSCVKYVLLEIFNGQISIISDRVMTFVSLS